MSESKNLDISQEGSVYDVDLKSQDRKPSDFFNQGRINYLKRYNPKFEEEIYKRIPHVQKIVDQGSYYIEEDGFKKEVLSLDDLENNVDAVVVTGNHVNYRFQYKVRGKKYGDSLAFDLKLLTYNYTEKKIIGAYYYEPFNAFFSHKFGEADVYAYLTAYNENVYFFDVDKMRMLFRYNDVWSRGRLLRRNYNDSYRGRYIYYIEYDTDIFLDLYNHYDTYWIYGKKI